MLVSLRLIFVHVMFCDQVTSDRSISVSGNLKGLTLHNKMFSRIEEEEVLTKDPVDNMLKDPDFDDELKLKATYAKYGLKGILERMDDWKKEPVDIAVSLYHCPTPA